MSLKFKTGTVQGTGAEIAVECGFTPSLIFVFNTEGLCHGIFTKDMTTAHVLKTVTDGTISEPTSLGIALTEFDDSAMGFTIGADTDLNVSGETIVWAAFGEA